MPLQKSSIIEFLECAVAEIESFKATTMHEKLLRKYSQHQIQQLVKKLECLPSDSTQVSETVTKWLFDSYTQLQETCLQFSYFTSFCFVLTCQRLACLVDQDTQSIEIHITEIKALEAKSHEQTPALLPQELLQKLGNEIYFTSAELIELLKTEENNLAYLCAHINFQKIIKTAEAFTQALTELADYPVIKNTICHALQQQFKVLITNFSTYKTICSMLDITDYPALTEDVLPVITTDLPAFLQVAEFLERRNINKSPHWDINTLIRFIKNMENFQHVSVHLNPTQLAEFCKGLKDTLVKHVATPHDLTIALTYIPFDQYHPLLEAAQKRFSSIQALKTALEPLATEKRTKACEELLPYLASLVHCFADVKEIMPLLTPKQQVYFANQLQKELPLWITSLDDLLLAIPYIPENTRHDFFVHSSIIDIYTQAENLIPFLTYLASENFSAINLKSAIKNTQQFRDLLNHLPPEKQIALCKNHSNILVNLIKTTADFKILFTDLPKLLYQELWSYFKIHLNQLARFLLLEKQEASAAAYAEYDEKMLQLFSSTQDLEEDLNEDYLPKKPQAIKTISHSIPSVTNHFIDIVKPLEFPEQVELFDYLIAHDYTDVFGVNNLVNDLSDIKFELYPTNSRFYQPVPDEQPTPPEAIVTTHSEFEKKLSNLITTLPTEITSQFIAELEALMTPSNDFSTSPLPDNHFAKLNLEVIVEKAISEISTLEDLRMLQRLFPVSQKIQLTEMLLGHPKFDLTNYVKSVYDLQNILLFSDYYADEGQQAFQQAIFSSLTAEYIVSLIRNEAEAHIISDLFKKNAWDQSQANQLLNENLMQRLSVSSFSIFSSAKKSPTTMQKMTAYANTHQTESHQEFVKHLNEMRTTAANRFCLTRTKITAAFYKAPDIYQATAQLQEASALKKRA